MSEISQTHEIHAFGEPWQTPSSHFKRRRRRRRRRRKTLKLCKFTIKCKRLCIHEIPHKFCRNSFQYPTSYITKQKTQFKIKKTTFSKTMFYSFKYFANTSVRSRSVSRQTIVTLELLYTLNLPLCHQKIPSFLCTSLMCNQSQEMCFPARKKSGVFGGDP